MSAKIMYRNVPEFLFRHRPRLSCLRPHQPFSLFRLYSKMSGQGGSPSTFHYFAYGSNLLTERIHISNPSARNPKVARLNEHKLDFNFFSKRWQGAVANVVPSDGDHVWGVLWELDQEHLATLDKQEGVPNVYNRKEIKVELEKGDTISAYTYYLVKPDHDDRRPSQVYLDVILRGAKEHPLPAQYIEKLSQVEHNGFAGEVNLNLDLKAINKIPD